MIFYCLISGMFKILGSFDCLGVFGYWGFVKLGERMGEIWLAFYVVLKCAILIEVSRVCYRHAILILGFNLY